MAPPQSTRFVTVHGHFYQPPRENPWLEAVETQDSAAPYHDWNERITAECYATNGAARMVDSENRIIRIMNNYAGISFNFGPTLLSWLEDNAPRVYAMIRAADRLSQKRFGGHGSAIAQVYNHIIMPLANTRDRITQIRWGIADFESRFDRKPEGMWLAETAVDFETLDLLAQHGIRFTILAPNQCSRVRLLEEPEDAWHDTPDASVDPTQPYLVRLNEGRTIAVFFYDGPTSRAIAFEKLLNSGEVFASRLAGAFRADIARPQLVHVATDGESYGHHHRHGEMALAFALKSIDENPDLRLTNYGEFLSLFPPQAEAIVGNDTSWSCFHGIERWRSDCGCSGGKEGWHQRWRGPLRDALDWLRDSVAPAAATLGATFFKDAEEARNGYISVILDRSKEAVDTFFEAHATHPLEPAEREQALQLLELERHAQLMYTSCGWFFDEISGIETIQIIAYACRVIELATTLFSPAVAGSSLAESTGTDTPLDDISLEDGFIARLSLAHSNVPDLEDGAVIYTRLVKTFQVGLEQVLAHYAISSVFAGTPLDANTPDHELYCYCIETLERRTHRYGAGQITLGRSRISSQLTDTADTFAYAVLHFGDQNLTAAVKRYTPADETALNWLKHAIDRAVAAADLPEVVRLIDGYFGESAYSLTSLFNDEQRRILHRILMPTLDEVEFAMTDIHREHASLMHFLSRAGLPKPAPLAIAAQLAINSGMRRALEHEPIDAEGILELLETSRTNMVVLETDKLGFLADQRMKHAMVRLQKDPADVAALNYALSLARTLHALPFGLNLWQAQNIWYDLHLQGDAVFAMSGRPASARKAARDHWRQLFPELGRQLSINVDHLALESSAAESLQETRSLTESTARKRRWDDV
jgi:alpha-amylase/alpha-mannosidase (GH57 family)